MDPVSGLSSKPPPRLTYPTQKNKGSSRRRRFMVEGRGAEGRRHSGTHDRGGLADPLLRASSEHFPKCAMREHGGSAWPPRLSALHEPRLLFPEVFSLTTVGRAKIKGHPLDANGLATRPPGLHSQGATFCDGGDGHGETVIRSLITSNVALGRTSFATNSPLSR